MPRLVWLFAGHVTLALAVVGIFLPILPTVPFLLLASFFYSRGSPRLEAWLVEHPRLGPQIREWRQYRVIRLRAKVTALLMVGASTGLVLWREDVPWAGKIAMLAVVLPVAVYVGTRPGHRPLPRP